MKQSCLWPVDQAPRVMSGRRGIEIDYCPACHGVWLDLREPGKILRRGNAPAIAQQAPHDPAPWPRQAGPFGDSRGLGRPQRKKSLPSNRSTEAAATGILSC